MIEFHYETEFTLENEKYYADWISRIISSETHDTNELNFIFCDDAYLLNLNQQFLDHDTFTDIITFDYSENGLVSGDVFISVERVIENSLDFGSSFLEELRRVMAHGVLHLLGYNDKTVKEQKVMRVKENEKLNMFHVEQ
ncbi:MAG: rRNA maturation RNase YbeY [Flavobacteriaceae bacterium]